MNTTSRSWTRYTTRYESYLDSLHYESYLDSLFIIFCAVGTGPVGPSSVPQLYGINSGALLDEDDRPPHTALAAVILPTQQIGIARYQHLQ